MRFSFRYNMRDALGLLTLVTLSTGLVYLVDQVAGAILDHFQSTVDAIDDGIVEAAGGLSVRQRSFFKFGISGIASGLLLSCLAALLLILRNYWATLVAFSLPLSMLFVICPMVWASAVPLTWATASAFVQPLVVAAIVASCLFAFCLYFNRRIEKSEFRTKATFSERPFWQKLILVTVFATYLLSCAYGWHRVASFRAAAIESMEYWESLELDADG